MGEVLLRTRHSRYGAIETLYVSGLLDIDSGPQLEAALGPALDGRGGEFHVDLSGLTLMDSAGASELLTLRNRVESLGRHLVLVSPGPRVREVLGILGLDQVLDVRSTPSGRGDLKAAGLTPGVAAAPRLSHGFMATAEY
jgi:anti-anti-sigma factor